MEGKRVAGPPPANRHHPLPLGRSRPPPEVAKGGARPPPLAGAPLPTLFFFLKKSIFIYFLINLYFLLRWTRVVILLTTCGADVTFDKIC
jgi:hypothetical protein